MFPVLIEMCFKLTCLPELKEGSNCRGGDAAAKENGRGCGVKSVCVITLTGRMGIKFHPAGLSQLIMF